MIRILIFEDNAQLAEGLMLLLNSVDSFSVKGYFTSLQNIETNVRELNPDVILMDIGFPSSSGIDGVKRIKRIRPEAKTIMLTGQTDAKNIFDSIKAGADGYLLKKTTPLKLIEYIKEAFDGGAPMTPTIARQVLQEFSTLNKFTSETETLTPREIEVLTHLVEGHSYKLVASELNIAIDTVRSHIRRIYEKLQVNSKSEAVAKAIRNNLV